MRSEALASCTWSGSHCQEYSQWESGMKYSLGEFVASRVWPFCGGFCRFVSETWDRDRIFRFLEKAICTDVNQIYIIYIDTNHCALLQAVNISSCLRDKHGHSWGVSTQGFDTKSRNLHKLHSCRPLMMQTISVLDSVTTRVALLPPVEVPGPSTCVVEFTLAYKTILTHIIHLLRNLCKHSFQIQDFPPQSIFRETLIPHKP